MPNYIRTFAPGGTFFFTVALLERRQCLLTEHINDLRSVFSAAKQHRPFIIEAIVILPDHLHCIWTLHIDYIHYNPVKHGHVAQVVDWPYSSFHRYVKLGILLASKYPKA